MPKANINQDEFTAEVLRAIRDYPDLAYRLPALPGTKGVGVQRRVKARRRVKTDEAKEYQRIATQLLRQRRLNTALCKALHSVAHDVFEIAKTITPLLISLNLAGLTTIPVNPLLFATIAMTIYRMGISALCAEYA